MARDCREISYGAPLFQIQECDSDNFTNCSKFVYKEVEVIEINDTTPLISYMYWDVSYVWTWTFTFELFSYLEDVPGKKDPLACFPYQVYDNFYVSIINFTLNTITIWYSEKDMNFKWIGNSLEWKLHVLDNNSIIVIVSLVYIFINFKLNIIKANNDNVN